MKIGKYKMEVSKFPYYKKILGRKILKEIDTKPVFIVGNQRSGTTMLLSKLNRHFWLDVFYECSNAMKDWRLKPFTEIEILVRESKAKVCIFKPLEDTHRIIEILDYFRDSKAFFVFRHYTDVINSSLKLGWGKHLKQYIMNINEGIQFEYSGPLNLNAANIHLVRDLFYENITEENCIAIIWYLRNTNYFDLNLSDDSRILLIQYEKLVTNPQKEMESIQRFINVKPSKYVLDKISKKSINKEKPPNLNNNISEICDNMFARLVASVRE